MGTNSPDMTVSSGVGLLADDRRTHSALRHHLKIRRRFGPQIAAASGAVFVRHVSSQPETLLKLLSRIDSRLLNECLGDRQCDAV